MAYIDKHIFIERVINFAKKMGYPVESLRDQRTIGPKIGLRRPPPGTVLKIMNIPANIYEDELIPFLSIAGPIYKFRLMLIPPEGILHSGCAYVTYENKESAELAFRSLNNIEMKPGVKITLTITCSNRRIFVGGIPNYKKKVEIWQELVKIGMKGINDVIMYRSYINRILNRGFVFVEFSTHEQALVAKLCFHNKRIFGENMINIDWSSPIQEEGNKSYSKVKTLVLKNIAGHVHDGHNFIMSILGPNSMVEDINFAQNLWSIGFKTRRDAQKGLSLLKQYCNENLFEVSWQDKTTNFSSLSTKPQLPTANGSSPTLTNRINPANWSSTDVDSKDGANSDDNNNLNDSENDLPEVIVSMLNLLFK